MILGQELENTKKEIELSENEITQEICETKDIVVSETTTKKMPITVENNFINAMTDNEIAINMAKDAYTSLKNQKDTSKKVFKVVKENTNADIDSVSVNVEEKKKNNAVKRQEIKNELYKLKQDKKLLKRESRHKLTMQKFEQRKEKYGDLLLRHCRKKVKNADGKWEFQEDREGNAIINMPNGFVLFWLIVFDSIVMFLNQTSDIFSSLNKVVFKVFWFIIIALILFIPPIRQWLFGLIGLNIG